MHDVKLVASAIHELSGRKGPFVAVNCAAIPEQLAESELFGHVAGAFTGARGDHQGFFRAADGGTIFLDEVGDLSPQLQPKLLRVLEQRVVMPVGATTPVPCDVRIVAATNKKLDAAVADQAFRGDLYARLSEFTVQLPPLCERREDVLLLLRHAFGADMPPLAPELVDAVLACPWPFNVRELMAVGRELRVRGAGKGKRLALELIAHRLHLDTAARPTSNNGTSASDPSVDRIASGSGPRSGSDPNARSAPPTREEFERILAECKGNVRQIAKATGRSRMQVYRWVEQFGLDLESYRDKP
jgi:DNA-binding NtrC family response regulator